MLDGIDKLLEYLNKYKNLEINNSNNKNKIKEIDNTIKMIEDRKYLTKFNFFEELIKGYENSDVDSIMYDFMLNVNRYNVYLMNKKIKFVEPNLDKDIELDDININIDDILDFLEVKEPLNKDLELDLKRFVKDDKNKNKLMDFARIIKTSDSEIRTLFDKIEDKNVLISILINSDINLVKGVINKLVDKNININKVVNNIPSIFIATKYNNKIKFDIGNEYSNFMGNIALLDNVGIEYTNMVKFPVFFVNNVQKNQKILEKLNELNVNIKNVLLHCGNILVINPDIIFKNINLLRFHNIELTDDNNNNGYTILGMNNLEDKINYLIESDMWKLSDGEKHDNIDLIRALIIKDDYLKWKNNFKYDIIENTSFEKKELDEEAVINVYEKFPLLIELDNKNLNNGNYVVGMNTISRHRLLKNLNNYRGKDNAMLESLKYKSNITNIDEVIKFFSSIMEMGDDGVKLSKGI